MKIINTTNNATIATSVVIADTFKTRMVGLLNRQDIKEGEALIITKCNSIHMFFMKFAIDAVFIDQENKIVGLAKNIKPFQVSPIYFKASRVIELPAGVIEFSHTEIGDQIVISV